MVMLFGENFVLLEEMEQLSVFKTIIGVFVVWLSKKDKFYTGTV